MFPTVAEGHRRTNAGDHVTASRGVPDVAGVDGAAASVTQGGEPMQTLRASAVALPFVGLAVLVGLLSMVIVPGT
jgi:hypothetical protein